MVSVRAGAPEEAPEIFDAGMATPRGLPGYHIQDRNIDAQTVQLALAELDGMPAGRKRTEIESILRDYARPQQIEAARRRIDKDAKQERADRKLAEDEAAEADTDGRRLWWRIRAEKARLKKGARPNPTLAAKVLAGKAASRQARAEGRAAVAALEAVRNERRRLQWRQARTRARAKARNQPAPATA